MAEMAGFEPASRSQFNDAAAQSSAGEPVSSELGAINHSATSFLDLCRAYNSLPGNTQLSCKAASSHSLIAGKAHRVSA